MLQQKSRSTTFEVNHEILTFEVYRVIVTFYRGSTKITYSCYDLILLTNLLSEEFGDMFSEEVTEWVIENCDYLNKDTIIIEEEQIWTLF